MKHTKRIFVTVALLGVGFGTAAIAQRGGGRTSSNSNTAETQPRMIVIPVVDAVHMMERMRVWLLVPPPGSSQYGIDGLGEGHRIWALLPTCGEPNPDDPRDPCPVDHVDVQVVTGTGEARSRPPENISSDSTRRVQSIVVPNSAEHIRIKLIRHDNGVRYEAAVDARALTNLPAPEGHPDGSNFAFDLPQYPSR